MSDTAIGNVSHWRPASRKRRALAIYIDFQLYSAVSTLAFWAVGKLSPVVTLESSWMRLALFPFLEFILLRSLRRSPGYWALGIRSIPPPSSEAGIVVDPDALQSERWWTLLLGMLLILEGTKTAVRWVLWHPPVPFMGIQLSATWSAAVSVVSGVFLCGIGFFLLRRRAEAALFGVALYAISLVSGLLSYDLMGSWAAADVIARRDYQGLPVREGEVELMQSLAPAIVVVTPVIFIVWLLAAHRRFRRTNDPVPRG